MSDTELKLEIDDAIVLLLGAPSNYDYLNGQLKGITRLEKLIFLLEKETSASKNWLDEDGSFVAYDFGPFSSKVYKAVDILSAAKILSDSDSRDETLDDSWEQKNKIGMEESEDPFVTRDFSLTPRGWRYYEVLVNSLKEENLKELVEFKNQFAVLPLRQLIRYVYQRYEEYTSKSLIKKEILGK
jgi:hypothetical protein